MTLVMLVAYKKCAFQADALLHYALINISTDNKVLHGSFGS